jgi:tetratricopeptide (TPR) repeat protein
MTTTPEPVVWEWASAYEKWQTYDAGDDDTLGSKPKDFEEMLEAEVAKNQAGPDGMGHYHDHHEERVFFEKPEEEKMRFCERHRVYGNALYEEGMLPKAAEQYHLTLSYYEYCFPDTVEKQATLEELRHACLCNQALCYYKFGEIRKAIACVDQVLGKDPHYVKALYRRAKAYRHLDEYDHAQADLDMALAVCPTDASLLREQQSLHRQKESSLRTEQSMSQRIMTAPISYTDLVMGMGAAGTGTGTGKLAAATTTAAAAGNNSSNISDGVLGAPCLVDRGMPVEAHLSPAVAALF